MVDPERSRICLCCLVRNICSSRWLSQMLYVTHIHTACLQSWGEPALGYRRRPGREKSTAGICRHSDAAPGRWENSPDTLCVCVCVQSTYVMMCVCRYCPCSWDSSAYSRDVLRSRPSVHTHHSPAAGMWPTGPENSRQVHPAERIPQQGVHDIRTAWHDCFYCIPVPTVSLNPSCSFRLSRAAWWRACQERGSSPGLCVCLSNILLLSMFVSIVFFVYTSVLREQGAGPRTDRSNPDECKGGALPALFTSPRAGRLWSWGCSERHARWFYMKMWFIHRCHFEM